MKNQNKMPQYQTSTFEKTPYGGVHVPPRAVESNLWENIFKIADEIYEPQGSEYQQQNRRPLEKGQNTRKQTQSGIKRQLFDVNELIATEWNI